MLARCMDVRTRRIAVAGVGVVMALAVLPAVLAGSAQPTAATRFASITPGAAAPASGDQYAIQVLTSAPIPLARNRGRPHPRPSSPPRCRASASAGSSTSMSSTWWTSRRARP